MDSLTEKLAASFPVEMMKQGLQIAEAPLKKLLEQRIRRLKSNFDWLYNERLPQIKEAGGGEYETIKRQIERAESDQEFLKAVAEYSVAVDGLLQAQTLENQKLREKLADVETANQVLREKLSNKVMDYLRIKFSRTRRFARLNLAVDVALLKYKIQPSENDDQEKQQ